jgi:hypothetical protein
MIEKDFKAETIHEVVKKLVGSTRPKGEANHDAIVLDNLKTLTEVTDLLIQDIYILRGDFEKDHQASVKRCVEKAHKFLTETKEFLNEDI